MAQRDRTTLKTFFETGDKPTQDQFGDLIDSCLNPSDDGINIPIIDTFTNTDLSSNILTVTHNKNTKNVLVTVYNASDIQEDLSGMLDTSDPDAVSIDFGGTISGTWRYIIQYFT